MQQDRDDIENIILQKEHAELPNVNHMENHWNKMQQLLMPNTIVAKNNFLKNIIGYGIAAVLITVLLVFVNNYSSNEEAPIAVKKNIETVAPINVLIDTALLKQKINSKVFVKNNTLPKNNTQIAVLDVKAKNITFSNIVNDTSEFKDIAAQIDSTKKSKNVVGEANQQLLNNFISSIQKRGERFTINNLRDTTIKAAEGTVFFIPMGSFNTKDSVIFEVKEYYKYSDMVANGLTTMADDKQLISGGMLSLTATVNGKEVTMNPSQEIRIFIPNLTAKDSMEIFEGKKRETIDSNFKEGGMIAQNNINWQLSKVRIDSAVLKMFIRAIDLKDDNIQYTTTYNNKTKAVFRRAIASSFSKSELLVMLRKKYGDYYDKIRIHNQWKRDLLFRSNESLEEEYYHLAYNSWGVGDTAELLPSTIRIYKLTPIDTVYKVLKWINKGYVTTNRPLLSANTLNLIGEKYSIGINKLGWINCDRFYNYAGRKSNVTVDLKDSAYLYITYMVFEKYKSIMQGYENGNMVIFPNIPMGEPLKIISIGIKNGKTIAAMKNTITSTNIMTDLPFEQTSTKEFKASLVDLDK
jgi:hypothetical protein